MTDSKHEPPPAACSDCVRALLNTITPGERAARGVYCPHAGKGTLVQIAVERGRVSSWHLQGPLTREEAAAIIESFEREVERRTAAGALASDAPPSKH